MKPIYIVTVLTVMLVSGIIREHHFSTVQAQAKTPQNPLTAHLPEPAPTIQPVKAPPIPKQAKIPTPPPKLPPNRPTKPPATAGCVTGYSTGQYALDQIIKHESGGRSCATNAGGCFGLLQACPGTPLRAACGGNPTCQIAWFKANKTGGRSWEQIWALWQTQGWW